MLIKFNSFDRAEKTVGSAGDRTREPTQTGERGEGQYHSDTLTYAATHTFKHTLHFSQQPGGRTRRRGALSQLTDLFKKRKKKGRQKSKGKRFAFEREINVALFNLNPKKKKKISGLVNFHPPKLPPSLCRSGHGSF